MTEVTVTKEVARAMSLAYSPNLQDANSKFPDSKEPYFYKKDHILVGRSTEHPNEYLISCRGVQDDLPETISLGLKIIDVITEQLIKEVNDCIKENPEMKGAIVTLCGHSRGGDDATAIGSHFRDTFQVKHIVTLNSPRLRSRDGIAGVPIEEFATRINGTMEDAIFKIGRRREDEVTFLDVTMDEKILFLLSDRKGMGIAHDVANIYLHTEGRKAYCEHVGLPENYRVLSTNPKILYVGDDIGATDRANHATVDDNGDITLRHVGVGGVDLNPRIILESFGAGVSSGVMLNDKNELQVVTVKTDNEGNEAVSLTPLFQEQYDSEASKQFAFMFAEAMMVFRMEENRMKPAVLEGHRLAIDSGDSMERKRRVITNLLSTSLRFPPSVTLPTVDELTSVTSFHNFVQNLIQAIRNGSISGIGVEYVRNLETETVGLLEAVDSNNVDLREQGTVAFFRNSAGSRPFFKKQLKEKATESKRQVVSGLLTSKFNLQANAQLVDALTSVDNLKKFMQNIIVNHVDNDAAVTGVRDLEKLCITLFDAIDSQAASLTGLLPSAMMRSSLETSAMSAIAIETSGPCWVGVASSSVAKSSDSFHGLCKSALLVSTFDGTIVTDGKVMPKALGPLFQNSTSTHRVILKYVRGDHTLVVEKDEQFRRIELPGTIEADYFALGGSEDSSIRLDVDWMKRPEATQFHNENKYTVYQPAAVSLDPTLLQVGGDHVKHFFSKQHHYYWLHSLLGKTILDADYAMKALLVGTDSSASGYEIIPFTPSESPCYLRNWIVPSAAEVIKTSHGVFTRDVTFRLEFVQQELHGDCPITQSLRDAGKPGAVPDSLRPTLDSFNAAMPKLLNSHPKFQHLPIAYKAYHAAFWLISGVKKGDPISEEVWKPIEMLASRSRSELTPDDVRESVPNLTGNISGGCYLVNVNDIDLHVSVRPLSQVGAFKLLLSGQAREFQVVVSNSAMTERIWRWRKLQVNGILGQFRLPVKVHVRSRPGSTLRDLHHQLRNVAMDGGSMQCLLQLHNGELCTQTGLFVHPDARLVLRIDGRDVEDCDLDRTLDSIPNEADCSISLGVEGGRINLSAGGM